ncbi:MULTISPECIES: BrnA antitoxin family protein [Ruminococcus]|nr:MULTISPECIES: BrnA antitoxin family protein [Ruminococcus]MBQ9542652.1 BrnA antitoxin family protein [Ruminococcus sp.]MBR0530512.1 BrnA antitoxin family protein [Ruminococcus sp.]MCC3349708.1 BrnA antitoxin family protein [Ruminococcus albus 8]
MREEYNINELNPRKNPYASRLKKQITINIDSSTIDFFKQQSADTGIPYQILINLYLADCVKNNKKPEITWK